MPAPLPDPSIGEFQQIARRAGLAFTDEEAPRMLEAYLNLRRKLIARLPDDPDMALEPALVFLPSDTSVAR